MATFGIGHPGSKTVTLWCTGERDAEGVLHFDVINGGWRGTLSPEGLLKVGRDSHEFAAEVLWEGDIPRKALNGWDRDYNGAIAYMNEQLANA